MDGYDSERCIALIPIRVSYSKHIGGLNKAHATRSVFFFNPEDKTDLCIAADYASIESGFRQWPHTASGHVPRWIFELWKIRVGPEGCIGTECTER